MSALVDIGRLVKNRTRKLQSNSIILSNERERVLKVVEAGSGHRLFTMLIITGIVIFILQAVVFFVTRKKDDAPSVLIILRAAIVLTFGAFTGLVWTISVHPIEVAINAALIAGIIVHLLLSLVTRRMETFLMRLASKDDVRLNKELEKHVSNSDVLVTGKNTGKNTLVVPSGMIYKESDDVIDGFPADQDSLKVSKNSPLGMKTVEGESTPPQE